MSPSTLAHLAGMLALFVGQRILDGLDEWQLLATATGALALVAAALLRVRDMRAAKDPGLRFGHRVALSCLAVGVAALVLYAGTTDAAVRRLGFDDAGEERWLGAMQSLWPIVWLLGTVPLLVVDYGLRSSPVVIPAQRVRETAVHGLVAAMGLVLVFPLNYIATKRNERFDLAYFKTPTPGTATQALVEALEQPVTVRIFMPPSSEVAGELRAYFAELEGPKLQVEIVDQAANPRLAKALAVRDNGTVALTQGDITTLMDEPPPAEGTPDDPHAHEEGEDDEAGKPITKRLRVDPELDKAKKTLKKLDAEVQKMLIELGQGTRVAYFTMGHGELNWSADKELLDASIRALKTRMTELGFSVKPLGLTEGLGETVPDDASLVLVLGPRKPFFQAEADALTTYLDRGGSVLIAREPAPNLEGALLPSDPLDGVMAKLGVKMGEGILASERNVVPLARNRLDAFNIVTNGFTSHSTTRQVSERSEQLVLVAPAAGHLEEVPEHAGSVVFVARSLAYSWADLDIDAEFDADAGETKEARNLMAVIESGEGTARYRAVVTADASMFSDLGVGLSLGNQRLAEDTLNWLIGAEGLAGTTENEEDVKIEHTKEDQQWWFYLSVLVVPLGVVLVGALRLRLRHKPTSPDAVAKAKADTKVGAA